MTVQTWWRAISARAKHASFLQAARKMARVFIPHARAFVRRMNSMRSDARLVWAAEDQLAGSTSFALSHSDEVSNFKYSLPMSM